MSLDNFDRVWNPFEEGPLTIEERIKKTGKARQDEVWQSYAQEDGAKAPLYDSKGVALWLCV